MKFLDGVLISSCFWFFIAVFALLRGTLYGYDMLDDPHLNWANIWDSGFDAGFEAAKIKNSEVES